MWARRTSFFKSSRDASPSALAAVSDALHSHKSAFSSFIAWLCMYKLQWAHSKASSMAPPLKSNLSLTEQYNEKGISQTFHRPCRPVGCAASWAAGMPFGQLP